MSLYIPVSKKDNSQGSEKAPIVLVEYGDYECPHCGAAYPIVNSKAVAKTFWERLVIHFQELPAC